MNHAYNFEKTLIVIPALNESGNLGKVLSELRSEIPESHILVVDDGSTDGTDQIAVNHGIPVLILPFNIGVGGAMRAGFTYAKRNNFEFVVQFDADGQHVPNEIHRLLNELSECDVVIGSRFRKESKSFHVSLLRRIVMRQLALILSFIVKSKLTDVTSGFRAAGPRAVEVFSRKYPPEYLGDTIESLVIAHRAKLVIGEIPTTIRDRNSGKSSQSRVRATIFTLRAFVVLILAIAHKSPSSSLTREQKIDVK